MVDGGSTDGTLAVLRRDGAHVAAVTSEPDRGPYDAMNKGLARATGEIVGFLNADDAYAAPDVLATVAAAMQADDLDAVFGDVAYVHGDAPDRIVRRYRSDRFSPDRIGAGWMPAHPALFLRREVYGRVGGFRTDYRIAGDFEFVVRAFAGNGLRYRHLSRILVMMRMGGLSTSGLRGTILLNREVLRACRENGVRTGILRLLSRYPAKLLEFVVR